MMDLLTDPQAWAALVALSALEIVLGIDNVVFISVLIARLDPARRQRARQIGLSLALLFRIVLLFGLTRLIALAAPVVTVMGNVFSWHDIVLIAGGLFLISKATHEIHSEVEGRAGDEPAAAAGRAVFSVIILQVIVIDLVFSVDSIITAIGMAQDIRIMIAAVLISVVIMYAASGPVARFVAEHLTTKMLALAFLILIGVALVADGFDFHIPRGYIYFAMAFAGAVEAVNIAATRRRRHHRE
ncbi:MAG TPA: TerC family protein [Xanthobacteraceae bacterium]|jgi:predicted tellurium resistance membrane protein TerC|nr:TerC family protein [Xanthobacteraceae bacterium]